MFIFQSVAVIPSTAIWSLLSIVGVAFAFAAVLALIAFVGSLFEKIVADGKDHIEPAQMPTTPAEVGQLTSAGLEVVKCGLSRADSLMNMYTWILASPDRTILAAVYKGKVGTTSTLLSHRSDGVWLVTKMAIGTPSLRPRRALMDALQSDTLEVTLALHRVRLMEVADALHRFEPDNASTAIEQAKRAYYEDQVDAGIARWIDPAQTTVKLTLKGCALSGVTVLSLPFTLVRYARRKPRIMAQAADLPSLRPLPIAAPPGLQGPVPEALPDQLVVIACTKPGAQRDYMPYTVTGKMYLPVFADEVQAMAYSGLYPATPGETRELVTVSRPWLKSCSDLGYELVLHPHMIGRRTIAAAELLSSPAATSVAG